MNMNKERFSKFIPIVFSYLLRLPSSFSDISSDDSPHSPDFVGLNNLKTFRIMQVHD